MADGTPQIPPLGQPEGQPEPPMRAHQGGQISASGSPSGGRTTPRTQEIRVSFYSDDETAKAVAEHMRIAATALVLPTRHRRDRHRGHRVGRVRRRTELAASVRAQERDQRRAALGHFKEAAGVALAQRGYALTDNTRAYTRWVNGLSVVEIFVDGCQVWWLSQSAKFPHELTTESDHPTLSWLTDALPYGVKKRHA